MMIIIKTTGIQYHKRDSQERNGSDLPQEKLNEDGQER